MLEPRDTRSLYRLVRERAGRLLHHAAWGQSATRGRPGV